MNEGTATTKKLHAHSATGQVLARGRRREQTPDLLMPAQSAQSTYVLPQPLMMDRELGEQARGLYFASTARVHYLGNALQYHAYNIPILSHNK